MPYWRRGGHILDSGLNQGITVYEIISYQEVKSFNILLKFFWVLGWSLKKSISLRHQCLYIYHQYRTLSDTEIPESVTQIKNSYFVFSSWHEYYDSQWITTAHGILMCLLFSRVSCAFSSLLDWRHELLADSSQPVSGGYGGPCRGWLFQMLNQTTGCK